MARRASTGSSSRRWSSEGFVRARIDGETVDLQGKLPALDKKKKHSIDIVVDRLVVKPGIEQRLASSLETALKVGGGLLVLAPMGLPEETLSQNYACIDCGSSLSEITPRLFSFNSPYGACPSCSGLGTQMGVDPDKVIADPQRSLVGGGHRTLAQQLEVVAHAHDRDPGRGSWDSRSTLPGASCPSRFARSSCMAAATRR